MTADAPAFVDSNILVYAFDASQPGKREVASSLIFRLAEDNRILLSTQVLQEFFVTVTRKIATPIQPEKALALVSDFAAWPVHVVDVETIRRACRLVSKAKLSFWDSLIICAAAAFGAGTLYSEDLQHGQRILGLRIVNPFLGPQ